MNRQHQKECAKRIAEAEQLAGGPSASFYPAMTGALRVIAGYYAEKADQLAAELHALRTGEKFCGGTVEMTTVTFRGIELQVFYEPDDDGVYLVGFELAGSDQDLSDLFDGDDTREIASLVETKLRQQGEEGASADAYDAMAVAKAA